MGNKCVITTRKNYENNGVGIYLHWNGGRDSVTAFLEYCNLKGYISPERDCYGWSRLAQVIGNFFGGTDSIGIDVVNNLDCDNYDNGVYLIENWKIVGRVYDRNPEQRNHNLQEMLLDIDASQPTNEQLGEFLRDKEVPIADLKIGDRVWVAGLNGYKLQTVVGFGEDKVRNGYNVKGLPYIDLYENNGSYDWNINNYLMKDTINSDKVRVHRENTQEGV